MTPPYAAEIVTVVPTVTGLVGTTKVALEAPAGTVTLAGTDATEVLLLESVTSTPPEAAVVVRKTAPCDELPPVNELGLSVNADSATGGGAGATVSRIAAVLVTPLYEAVRITDVLVDTALVDTVKFALVAPEATITDPGTFACVGLLLVRITGTPPDPAGPVNVIVP